MSFIVNSNYDHRIVQFCEAFIGEYYTHCKNSFLLTDTEIFRLRKVIPVFLPFSGKQQNIMEATE